MYAQYDTAAPAIDPVVFILDDTTANEAIFHYHSSSNSRFRVVDGGVGQCNLDGTAVVANIMTKVIGVYAVNDFSAAKNGVLATPDTSGTLPTTTQMRVGASGSTSVFGHIKQFDYWPERKSNAELQARTA